MGGSTMPSCCRSRFASMSSRATSSAPLRVLDHEDHDQRDDRRGSVDDQLPVARPAIEGTRNKPQPDEDQRDYGRAGTRHLLLAPAGKARERPRLILRLRQRRVVNHGEIPEKPAVLINNISDHQVPRPYDQVLKGGIYLSIRNDIENGASNSGATENFRPSRLPLPASGERVGVSGNPQLTSTMTISASSSAVTVTTRSFSIAAPSRSSRRTPLTS